jgi:O-antigen ligase
MPYIILLLYTFVVYVRPFDINPVFIQYRPMLVLGILCLLATLIYLPLSHFSWKARQAPLVMIFTAILILSRIFALHWVGGALAAMDEFAIVAIYFFAVIVATNSLPKLRWLAFTVAAASLIVALQSMYAYYFGSGDFRELFVLEQRLDAISDTEWNILERVRALGFFADPNDLAQGLLTMVPLIFLAWKPRSVVWNSFFVLAPVSVLMWCIYLTHSRGAAVALVIVVVFWLTRRLGKLWAGLMTGGMVFGLVAINIAGSRLTKDESVVNRFEAWSMGLELLKSHPLFGVGYRLFTDYNPITAHNSYVLCFSELGFIGFFVWMAIIYLTVKELNQLINLDPADPRNRELRRYAESIRLSMIGFLSAAWFLSRTYALPLFFLVGLSVVLAEIARREDRMPPAIGLPALGARTLGLCMATIAVVYLSVKLAVR